LGQGKGTVEKGFDNGRLGGRSSLVNLRRLEPPRGKRFRRGRVLGRWNRQMRFKRSSSRKVERERPLGGVARKYRGEALG
jgi:hypothetical protein